MKTTVTVDQFKSPHFTECKNLFLTHKIPYIQDQWLYRNQVIARATQRSFNKGQNEGSPCHHCLSDGNFNWSYPQELSHEI